MKPAFIQPEKSRREAGNEYRLADSLILSAISEFEYARQQISQIEDSENQQLNDKTATLQVGVEYDPSTWVGTEILYEYEKDEESDQLLVDEALVTFEANAFELELGRLNLPFGVYYSHFVSGPLIEFGETRGNSAVLTYQQDDAFKLVGFAFYSSEKERSRSHLNPDWGFAVESSPTSFLRIGGSVLSDLAASKEDLLADSPSPITGNVLAASGFAAVGIGNYELTAEALGALQAFKGIESERDQPRAWNLEFTYFPIDVLDFSFRLEHSDDLEDTPRLQRGIAAAWRVTKDISITSEFLLGSYERNAAGTNESGDSEAVRQLSTQMSVAF